ncbi:YcxB family protein [Xanthomonas campestris]|uniref:YcxB family protein n=1 Tax=Xanthomonas campestris TaxID=339 RepID=UPI00236618F4|nr:YcxB family protein [Xanthomonas campestris]MEA0759769.1 YcxB family protein [Xanthomonas campestris pv. campestris]MEB1221960.1 YcxB family protein [Xanthomonas campestris pv. campestris]MEB1242565.1 YcxB family protein [Xanthomonas campestris pv. campestris]MEB1250739.1 YcxB family protein [Xanthomonas campestris pv. campestris]MEB1292241.1 YcxB family protein [Xanthomonas campestris pv. campestris]
MISATISLEDHLAAQRLHARHTAKRLIVVLVVLLLIGMGLLQLIGAGDIIGPVLIGAGGGGLIGLAVLHLWGLPRKIKRLHAQQAALRHTYTYAWDDTGLDITWADGHLRRPWSDYIRCRENERVLLLYHNDRLFELFAPHWFADRAQYEAFRHFALQVGKAPARR